MIKNSSFILCPPGNGPDTQDMGITISWVNSSGSKT